MSSPVALRKDIRAFRRLATDATANRQDPSSKHGMSEATIDEGVFSRAEFSN